MEAKVNYAVVGAFVLVLAAALIAGVLWLSSGKTFRHAFDHYLIYMTESVSGLSVDAPVRYRGVQVGSVRRIALAPGNVEQVQLLVAIDRGTPVMQDTVAELRVQGLTGIAHIELTGGSQTAPRLEVARPGEEYPVIRSDPSLLVRLDASVTTLLTNLNTSSERVNALLDDNNRAAFKELLANLHVLSRTLAARSATIDAGLANASKAMENTARVTAELSQLVERMRKSADTFDRMSDKVASAGTAASSAIDGARAEGRQFAGDTLPEVRALLAELRELSGSLRRLGDEIERDPSVLIRGRAALKPGPGE